MINTNLNDAVLECDWMIVLPVYNTSQERNRVISFNYNIRNAVYPLTRNYLNGFYNQTNYQHKSYFNFDCAASMYSYFLTFYGRPAGYGASNFPFATGAGVSTGYNFLNPLGVDWDILPGWLWILILIGAVIVVKKAVD